MPTIKQGQRAGALSQKRKIALSLYLIPIPNHPHAFPPLLPHPNKLKPKTPEFSFPFSPFSSLTHTTTHLVIMSSILYSAPLPCHPSRISKPSGEHSEIGGRSVTEVWRGDRNKSLVRGCALWVGFGVDLMTGMLPLPLFGWKFSDLFLVLWTQRDGIRADLERGMYRCCWLLTTIGFLSDL